MKKSEDKITCGKGIKQLLQELKPNEYTFDTSKTLTKSFIEKLLNSTTKDIDKSGKREIIFTTGFLGMVLFDLAMLGLYIDMSIRVKFTTFKHSRVQYYLSLFKKHGNIKVAVIYKLEGGAVFECYDGTQLIHTCTKLDEEVIKYLKTKEKM